uniref:Uncharacterized protein n=1 Tax=Arundo donax TaxID=35708 RepID=A0A0A8ZZZ5_ARUDO
MMIVTGILDGLMELLLSCKHTTGTVVGR